MSTLQKRKDVVSIQWVIVEHAASLFAIENGFTSLHKKGIIQAWHSVVGWVMLSRHKLLWVRDPLYWQKAGFLNELTQPAIGFHPELTRRNRKFSA